MLDKAVVYLESVPSRLHKHRLEAVLGNGENGGNVGIGRHYNLVAILQHSHLLVGTKYEGKGIETVAASHAVAGAYIFGKLLAEIVVGGTLQIPAAIDHTCYGSIDFVLMQCRNVL